MSLVGCRLCEYHDLQHNASCCCARCWQSRQQQQQQQRQQVRGETGHTTQQALTTAPTAPTASSVPPRQPRTRATVVTSCVHAGGHQCVHCLLPPYRYTVPPAPRSSRSLAENRCSNSARVYRCDGCAAVEEERHPRRAPAVGCGCPRYCTCRRGRAASSGVEAGGQQPVRFSPDAVPKMGPAAAHFMRGQPSRERARFLY